MHNIISGKTPATPLSISTISYFSTPTLSLTQTREPLSATETMGEANSYRAFYMILYYVARKYRQKFKCLTLKNRDHNIISYQIP